MSGGARAWAAPKVYACDRHSYTT